MTRLLGAPIAGGAPDDTDGSESIVVVCPDSHITLWPTRLAEAATGGGKSAILRLAAAWARAGHPVTVACAAVVEGEVEGVRFRDLARAAGRYDVAVYVTGLLGHFEHPAIDGIKAGVRVLWQNPPHQVAFPPGPPPDWIVVPARFLAHRGGYEWGYPPERIVVIPGEAVSRRLDPVSAAERDELAVIYASHPRKGLREAIEVLGRVRPDYPVRLDVYGSGRLWHDDDRSVPEGDHPAWVQFKGDVPAEQVASVMARYGAMLWRDVPSRDLQHIRERLADDSARCPSLADLARLTGLSRYQVLRRFERAYGLPPHAWLLRRRAERARVLIRDGCTLAVAAVETGFADQSHMTRVFARQFGFTPGAWRRAARLQ